MLVFSNYAKNYASTIYNSVIEGGLECGSEMPPAPRRWRAITCGPPAPGSDMSEMRQQTRRSIIFAFSLKRWLTNAYTIGLIVELTKTSVFDAASEKNASEGE